METNTESAEMTNESLIVPSLSVIEQQERASIDMLISTAKKYPRDLVRVKRSMEAMATLDVETAEGCNYTLKRKDKTGTEVLIQGPSVRMAEIAVASYTNIRAGSRVIANNGKIITGQAFCHDLENNIFIAWETERRITDKNGRTYGEDLQVLTGNAASAIAFRNAVFKVIPSALVKPVADKALQVAVGDIKTLEERRQRAVRKFASLGVDTARLLAFLGKTSVMQIDIADVENLFGIFTAIKEGTVSIEEQFPKEPKIIAPNFGGNEAAIPSPAAATADIPRRRGRPPKNPVQSAPAEAKSEAAEPKPESEPESADPATQETPAASTETRQEPPPASAEGRQPSLFGEKVSTPQAADPYTQIRRKLVEAKISQQRFLSLLLDNELINCEPYEITTGDFDLSKVDEQILEHALRDWDHVSKILTASAK